MATTKEDIKAWLARAKEKGATHMIVICDTYDWEDYPHYSMSYEDACATVKNPGEMQKVMEVYAMHLPFDKQLNEYRANHLEKAPAKKVKD